MYNFGSIITSSYKMFGLVQFSLPVPINLHPDFEIHEYIVYL